MKQIPQILAEVFFVWLLVSGLICIHARLLYLGPADCADLRGIISTQSSIS
jgi:hypothetical protein